MLTSISSHKIIWSRAKIYSSSNLSNYTYPSAVFLGLLFNPIRTRGTWFADGNGINAP